jgi:acetyl esterase/lipase
VSVRRARWTAVVLALVVLAACSGGGDDASPPSSRSSTTSSTRGDGTDPCDPAIGRRAMDIRYVRRANVPARQTSLDVYTPSVGCPAPVVMWVHGGGWTGGDKRNRIIPKVVAFTSEGYVVVSVNYRLLDPQFPDRVRYPAFNEDVATAVAWVRRNIARYGGDPKRIALVGHSAGAAIAASVATDPRYLKEHDLGLDALRCVAPLDTEAFDVRPLANSPIHQRAFGVDPGQLADASPITHVAPDQDIPPFFVVLRGTAGRRAGVDAFVGALRAASVPVTVVEAGGLTHAQVSGKLGAPGDATITPPVLAFLEECFRR